MVADVAKATDAIRDAVVEQVGNVVETVREAVDWGAVWDGVKTVGNVIGEVTGFNDIKNCVTKGDMEACAWAVATVAGMALGGAGAGLVRAAKAGRMASKAAKYADEIAKAANKLEKVEEKVDKIESAVECASTAMDVASLATGNSFVPGTRVLMADGTRKPIEKVEAGDQVLATDPTTGKTSKQEVTDTIKGRGLKKLVRLTVDTDGDKGSATDTITATAGHPFWVPSLKKWQKAGELKPGQWLQTGNGTWVQVDAVQAWTQQAAVYNLTIDTAHTYYVAAGATPVLVHNCDHVVLGVGKHSDALARKLGGRTFNKGFTPGREYNRPHPDGDGRPEWMVEVSNAIRKPETRLSVSLDGITGATSGDHALSMLMERGVPVFRKGWEEGVKHGNQTAWEMGNLRMAVITGQRKYDSVDWHYGGESFRPTRPDWAD